MGAEVARLQVRFGADTSEAEAGIARLQSRLGGFQQNMQRIGQTALGFAAGQAVFRGVTGAIKAAGDAIVGFNSHLEQSRIAWTTMLGSAEKASYMMEELFKFAKRTPFSFEGVEDSARRLMAMRFEASEILPLLEDIGNVSAGLSAGTEGVNRITLALGQMMAKGKVNGQDMRQMSEMGINAWGALADFIGKSISETMAMSEKGLIPAEKMVAAFRKFSQENFAGLMEKQSRTFGGLMSNIGDSLRMMAAEAGRPIFDRLTAMAEKLEQALSSGALEGALSRIRLALETFFAVIDAMPAPVKEAIGQFLALAAAGVVLAPVISGIGAALTFLTGPVGIAAAAIVALSAAWKSNFGGIRDVVAQVWPQISETLLRGVSEIVSWFETQLPKVKEIVRLTVGYMVGFWQQHGATVKAVVKGMLDFLGRTFQRGLAQIGSFLDLGLALLRGDWQGAWEALKQIVARAWVGIVDAATTGVTALMRVVASALRGMGKVEWADNILKSIEDIQRAAQLLTDQANGWAKIETPIKSAGQAMGSWGEVVAKADKATGGLLGRLGALFGKMLDTRDAANQAGAGLGGAKSKVDELGNSASAATMPVARLVAAMVAVHPATRAAAAQVAHWQAQIAGMNAALQANQQAVNAAQNAYAEMQKRLERLNKRLDEAKQRLQALASPRLVGMGEIDRQIAALERHLSRVRLARSLGAPLAQVVAQFPMLAEGAEAFLATMPQSEQGLRRMLERLQAIRSLRYDEQLAALQAMVNPPPGETTFETAALGIPQTLLEISELEALIAKQESVLVTQQALIDSLQGAQVAMSQMLATYQTQLQVAQEGQTAVEKGLQAIYQWLLNDRKEMIGLGGDAAKAALQIDEQVRTLMGQMDAFVGDTSGSMTTSIQNAVSEYQNRVNEIVAKLAEIPTEILTVHRVVTVYQNAGAPPPVSGAGAIASAINWLTGLFPGMASGGPVRKGSAYIVGEQGPELFVPRMSGSIAPNGGGGGAQAASVGVGDVYVTVEGSVITERDLAQRVREILLQKGRSNNGVGLA
jgi:tape measure domain-containing protein